MRIPSLIALALGASIVAGCAKSTAPRGWLSSAGEAGRNVRGGWVSAVLRSNPRGPAIEGEFIAVENESVFVLTAGELRGFPAAEIARATVSAYDIHSDRLSAWTLLGTLSTLSHGYALIVSAPVWIVAGSVSTAAASRHPLHDVPRESWRDLSGYARFPRGLPPTIDRGSLIAK